MPKFFMVLLMILALMFTVIPQPAAAQEDLDALFEAAAAAWLSPSEAGQASGSYTLRTGESAYVPAVSPGVIPFDEETPVIDTAGAVFESTDDQVVSVDAQGLMTGVAEGVATVICTMEDTTYFYGVTVEDDAMHEIVKNFVYVAKREFYLDKKEYLPKANQYSKWYYKSSKEVGWCSVFTIWCANAAGFDTIEEEDAKEIPDDQALFVREGQVGNQYDAFSLLNRFVGVPRPGYLVIYANMKNAYLYTHIGIVTDVTPLNDGLYQVTTVEGNMSSTVKSYTYVYDSSLTNHQLTNDSREKLNLNIFAPPEDQQTDPLTQYGPATENFTIFGFCATWL